MGASMVSKDFTNSVTSSFEEDRTLVSQAKHAARWMEPNMPAQSVSVLCTDGEMLK